MNVFRDKIVLAIEETADIRGTEVGALLDETVLLESGLDSLGFAILVARLEEELGYDPFVMMQEPVYPRTLGEFIEIYQQQELEKINDLISKNEWDFPALVSYYKKGEIGVPIPSTGQRNLQRSGSKGASPRRGSLKL